MSFREIQFWGMIVIFSIWLLVLYILDKDD